MKRKSIGLLAAIAIGTMSLAAPAMAKTIIRVWSHDGSEAPSVADTFSKEFNAQNSDIQIEYRIVPFDDLVSEALRAFATGQAPDIISLDNPDFALFSARGAFLDITDRAAASSVIDTKAYYKGPLNSVMWDSKLYGLPKFTDTIALFYNQDLFAKAGIAAPPKTWKELVDTAAKLTDPANNTYGITFSARAGEEGTFQFLPWIQMAGGNFDHVNVPGAAEAINDWKAIIDAKSASQDVLSMGQWTSTGTFNAGNAAMAISGPWELNRMTTDAKFKWGVALLPTQTEGGPRSSALGGFNWGIFSSTKHPDEAFKVLEYFVSQDKRLFPEFGFIPARSDIALPETGAALKDAGLKVFKEQLTFAQPRGPHPEWQKISKAIYTAMQEVLTGQSPAQDALDRAQSTIKDIKG